MLKNTNNSYGLVSITLHWLFLILIVATIIIIGAAEDMPDGPEKYANIGLHKSIGVLLLVLVTLRLFWRLTNERPEPLGANSLENKLGHLMHLTFYVLLFAQPIFGVLMSQSAGYDVSFFGLFNLPTLVGENEAFGDVMHEAHGITGLVLVLGIVLHALAGLKHHFINKDRTLVRMLKGK